MNGRKGKCSICGNEVEFVWHRRPGFRRLYLSHRRTGTNSV